MQLQEPLHMNEIVDGLWLGSEDAATDVKWLDHFGIRHIISLREPHLQKEIVNVELKDRTYHRFWINDKDSADISQYFIPIIEIINQCFLFYVEKRTRVGTLSGRSYLIYRYRFPADDAIEFICRRRVVSPNDGFVKQLNIFAILLRYFGPYYNQTRSKP
jgi:hypothetical protein